MPQLNDKQRTAYDLILRLLRAGELTSKGSMLQRKLRTETGLSPTELRPVLHKLRADHRAVVTNAGSGLYQIKLHPEEDAMSGSAQDDGSTDNPPQDETPAVNLSEARQALVHYVVSKGHAITAGVRFDKPADEPLADHLGGVLSNTNAMQTLFKTMERAGQLQRIKDGHRLIAILIPWEVVRLVHPETDEASGETDAPDEGQPTDESPAMPEPQPEPTAVVPESSGPQLATQVAGQLLERVIAFVEDGKAELEQLRAERSTWEERLHGRIKETNEALAQLHTTAEELKEVRAQLEEAVTRSQGLSSRLQETEVRLEQTERELEEERQQRPALERELRDARAEVGRLAGIQPSERAQSLITELGKGASS